MTSARPPGAPPPELHFTLKVISRCNLDCSYCYVYHKADQTWRDRPAVMSDEVFLATVARIQRHCEASGQPVVRIVLHGGEPTMLGKRRFARWCRFLRRTLSNGRQLILNVQTNGALLDADWAEIFAEHRVGVGISLDGPQDQHDRLRVDHFGRGSYDAVVRGIAALAAARLPLSLLSVIDPLADPVATHEHLASFSPRSIDYLLPDASHDDIGALRAAWGPTPCADYLIAVFDHWQAAGPPFLDISPLKPMALALMDGQVDVDFIGNRPYRYLFVETDGAIEGLDVLRVCESGLSATGLNVLDHDFVDLRARGGLHAAAIFEGLPLPAGCGGCGERDTCGGGYLPHRFASGRGLDHPSAWCADLYKLFAHIRRGLGLRAAVPPPLAAARSLAPC